MNKKEKKKKLLEELRKLQEQPDIELAHLRADRLLIRYIDDDKVTEMFNKVKRWYA